MPPPRRRVGSLGLALAVLVGSHSTTAQSLPDLRRSAERGDTSAQVKLGTAYRDGLGVQADPVEAYMWLSFAWMFGPRADRDVTHPGNSRCPIYL